MQHHFDVELAIKYGVPAAIVLDHLQGWIYRNKANAKNFHQGRTWTYNSIQALTAIYPYWTVDQIRKVYDDLGRRGVILKSNFSPKKNDRTLWYAFVDETAFLSEFDIWQKTQMDLVKNPNGFGKKPKCIGTVTNEPCIKPIPTKEISQNLLSFARELNDIIPARSNSDWHAYANIANKINHGITEGKCTEASFEMVREIAREAAKAKVTKKIALFFKLLAERMNYKRQMNSSGQSIGSLLNSMMIA